MAKGGRYIVKDGKKELQHNTQPEKVKPNTPVKKSSKKSKEA